MVILQQASPFVNRNASYLLIAEVVIPVAFRRGACFFLEYFRKIALILEAALAGDVREARVIFKEELFTFFDPHLGDIRGEAHPGFLLENAAQI